MGSFRSMASSTRPSAARGLDRSRSRACANVSRLSRKPSLSPSSRHSYRCSTSRSSSGRLSPYQGSSSLRNSSSSSSGAACTCPCSILDRYDAAQIPRHRPSWLQPLLAQPQAHRRRTGGIGFLHMHPLPFLHPFCISVTQTRAFGNKQTPSAAGGGSLYAVVSRAWRRRGWSRPAAGGAASPRPFPCGRRRSAYRSWGCPSSSGAADSEPPRQSCR